ncbi:MAG TPA: hypothetical protein VEA99_04080 [Gemmatimonadaceae bacterium]|nr:hypothetical protein [Gemmatimonadaceae bacterium]
MTIARFTLRPIALAVCLALAGCVRPLFPGSERIYGDDGLNPRPDRTGMRESANGPQLARKVVSGKEAPSTLVAPDGSRCSVTERRFKEVTEGEKVTCAWRST